MGQPAGIQLNDRVLAGSRLTNAFSKKVENHAYAVELHMMYFVRMDSKLRMSPAMAAGVSKRLWKIADIVVLIEAEEAKIDRKRGPYRKAREQKERTL